MRRRSRNWSIAPFLVVGAVLAGTSLSAGASAVSSSFHAPRSGYLVYWDNNEEVDYYASASNTQGQLMPPWDLNGQVCVLNDGSGRYVGGYDPTNYSQHNPGGPPHNPFKQPADGEEMNGRHGLWTGLNLYIPGPFKMPKGTPGVTASSPGGDSPPDTHGIYNGQQTYTGCAVDSQHNVFGADIATAQGQVPIPSSGRLVEWFAPKYTSYCVLYGPTTGGVDGTHHTDGSGGLIQPGMMATDSNDNLYVPQGGGANGVPPGNVTEFSHSSFPTSASECPDGIYPRANIKSSVFIQSTGSLLPVPQGIAKDPKCNCWAVSTLYGSPSIAWFNDQGQYLSTHPSIPGELLSDFGHSATGYNPFGIAFAPDGTLYFVDIHVLCQGTGLTNCGASNQGRLMRVTFVPNGTPSAPVTLASGMDFPTSATVCVPSRQVCPFPTHHTPPPNRAPA